MGYYIFAIVIMQKVHGNNYIKLMKKVLIAIAIFFAADFLIFDLGITSSVLGIFTDQNVQQTRNILRNTTWVSSGPDDLESGIFAIHGIFEIVTIEFGSDNNFLWIAEGMMVVLPYRHTERGTYTINGSDVVLNKEDQVLRGKITGNILEIDNKIFRRQR